jgi:SAM-dependent methyltransferase
MLDFYPRTAPRLILDATVNARRFWKGSKRLVIGLDIDPTHRPDIVADNLQMPFADESFDVVVFDPPHIPNQGKDRSKDFNARFGLGLKSPIENGYNFSHLFPPFAEEAWRVLIPEGILLCKIADYVHGHRYQGAHVELINACSSAGFCLRLHNKDSSRPDCFSLVEECPSHEASPLLLAGVSQVREMRVIAIKAKHSDPIREAGGICSKAICVFDIFHPRRRNAPGIVFPPRCKHLPPCSFGLFACQP